MSLESENERLRKELDVIRSRYESLSEHSSDAAVVQANALSKSLLSTRRGATYLCLYEDFVYRNDSLIIFCIIILTLHIEHSELKASQEALRAEFMSQMNVQRDLTKL